MRKKTLRKVAASIGLAFFIAAAPTGQDVANAARDTEPYSCTVNGRTYDPQPSAIVVDSRSGDILVGDNIDAPRYPASMTKMMTAALIFDAIRDGRLKLADQITMRISPEIQATQSNSRSTWLANGTKLSVEQAILAIAVASSNNVSVLMAEQIAGSEQRFVALMNDKARSIGMSKTTFRNSTGLPDKAQISTARDMAKLALYIYNQYPEFYHYFSAEKAEFGPWKGKSAKYNHNELVIKHDHVDGIKTGFICDAGYNLAASANDNGHTVISIVFGGRTPHKRNETTMALINKAFLAIQSDANKQGKAVANIHDDVKTNVATNPSPTQPG